MRLLLVCVLGWFVIAAAAALASHDVETAKHEHGGRHDRSGSLIVALGAPGS